MRDRDGRYCSSKVEHAGEDPANDEGVRVSLRFECTGREIFYDASKFLSAHGAGAWQVVTITPWRRASAGHDKCRESCDTRKKSTIAWRIRVIPKKLSHREEQPIYPGARDSGRTDLHETQVTLSMEKALVD
jgi:hypothetical protein